MKIDCSSKQLLLIFKMLPALHDTKDSAYSLNGYLQGVVQQTPSFFRYNQTRGFFAWLFNLRRTLVRHEYKAENYLAFVLLACMKVMLRYF